MNAYYDIRSSCGVPIAPPIAMGHGLFSAPYTLDVPMTRCTLMSNGYPVRLRRPYLREAPAGFGLGRLATAFMKNPG